MAKSIHLNYLIRKIGDGYALQGNREKLFTGKNAEQDCLSFVDSDIQERIEQFKQEDKNQKEA